MVLEVKINWATNLHSGQRHMLHQCKSSAKGMHIYANPDNQKKKRLQQQSNNEGNKLI